MKPVSRCSADAFYPQSPPLADPVRLLSILAATCALCCAQTYIIETVAGSHPSGDGGPATSALLSSPCALIQDAAGNLYFGEAGRVRKIAPDGTITTVAGTGVVGFSGDQGPAITARIHSPEGLAIDPAGNLYIADSAQHRVRKVTREGLISTVAGTGTRGSSGDGQRAELAGLDFPRGLALDRAGNLYIVDGGGSRIRKVSAGGIITTIAGDGQSPGFAGDGGDARTARLWYPQGNPAIDAAGTLYFTDTENKRVRRISADGKIATVASGLTSPRGIVLDGAGDLYVTAASLVHKITPGGAVSAIAGTGSLGFSGDGGPATSARISYSSGIAVSASGTVYFCDQNNHRVRRVAAGIIATVAGRSRAGGDNGPATSAFLSAPVAVALDSGGGLYIADYRNHRVRKVNAQGIITTLAGNGETPAFGGDNGPAASAQFAYPSGVAVDGAGNVYVADMENNRIRKVWTDGRITTIAGSSPGWGGDGRPAAEAWLNGPRGLAIDAAGNLYVADSRNHCIRRIDTAGVISTVAGSITTTGATIVLNRGFAGDGGPAANARLDSPYAIAFDAAGNLYIADSGNRRIRRVDSLGIIETFAEAGSAAAVAVDPAGNVYYSDWSVIRRTTPAGVTSTIAGTGREGFSGDGGPGTWAQISNAQGLAVDAGGRVYIADTNNDRIRRLSPVVPGEISIVRGDGQTGDTNCRLSEPLVVRVLTTVGTPAPGLTVAFQVARGNARLSANSAMTGPDGTASVVVTLGASPGEVVVTATVADLPPARFMLTAVLRPLISSLRGSASGSETTAPGALLTIHGSGLASGSAYTPTARDYVDGRLPVRLRGTCVEIGSSLAPITMISPTQVNVVVPWSLFAGESPVQVMLNCGEPNEVRSRQFSVVVQSAAPEFFFAQAGEGGAPAPIVAAFTDPPGMVGARTLGPDYRPAKPGDTITIPCNGLGMTDPPLEDGQIPASRAAITGSLTLTIGDIVAPTVNILYAGLTPGSMSGYQVVVRIPDDVPEGDLPVVLAVNGFRTLANGYLTIQR